MLEQRENGILGGRNIVMTYGKGELILLESDGYED